jgi:restriction endonuclease S subunit
MKNEETSLYFKFLDEEGKLDFRNNLTINLPSTKFNVVPLGQILDFREDKIEPSKKPIQKFNLIGVLDVPLKRTKTKYQEVIGAKILSQKLIIHSGDVVISRINPRKNRVAVIPENKNSNQLIGSTEFYSMYSKFEESKDLYVYPQFLAFFLKTNYAKKQMLSKISGLTPSRARIPIDEFKKVLIPLPKPKEQLKILKDMENKNKVIEDKRKQLKKDNEKYEKQSKIWNGIELREVKKLDFYCVPADEMEERIDFIANNPEIKKAIESIKENENDLINELLEQDFEYGVNDYGKEKGKIPFINIENLTPFGKINFDGVRFLNNFPEEKTLKKNDLLISRSRNVGVCAIFKNERKSTFGSYILRFRVKKPEHILYYLNSEFGKLQVLYYKTGSTGFNINPNQLKKIAILKEDENTIKMFKELIKKIEDNKLFVNKEVNNFSNNFENKLIKN